MRYYQTEYGPAILVAWVSSLVLAWIAFKRMDGRNARASFSLDRRDRRIILLLLVMFAPFYLAFVYLVPFQVSTDEMTIMMMSAELTAEPGWDIFSLSTYFEFPAFAFIVVGALGRLAGGIELANMRMIHASFGVVIVALSYLFFRTMLSRRMALAAAILLGVNHALLAISRMAMRDNSALLVELAALTLLFLGYRNRRMSLSFAGGAVASVSLYVYAPGRLTIAVWGLFLILTWLSRPSRKAFRRSAGLGIPALIGFAIVAGPIAAAIVNEAPEPGAFQYQRHQLLFSQDGLELQQDWVDAGSKAEAVRINVLQGLTAYNNLVHDNGFIYYNPGHGFVDPLTGILLWVGVIVVIRRLREREAADILMLSGLLLYWLTFSFVSNKAPSYTRLLVTLPFVSYLALQGIARIASWIRQRVRVRESVQAAYSLGSLATWVLVGVIAIWNLLIYADFVRTGLEKGNEVGSLVRYIDARRDLDDYSFILAPSGEYPLDSYDTAYWWREWIEFITADNHYVDILESEGDLEALGSSPLTVFIGEDYWDEISDSMTEEYPDRVVHNLMADGSFLAIEVTDSKFRTFGRMALPAWAAGGEEGP